MYLAEDRILCFEIVTKKNAAWVLKYVKSAKAVTDVPTTVPEFISQRRRWLNGTSSLLMISTTCSNFISKKPGSFFASLHATLNFFKIWTSGHSFLRKLALQFEFIYNGIQMIFAWTSLANFYLSFFFLSVISPACFQIIPLGLLKTSSYSLAFNQRPRRAPMMLSTFWLRALVSKCLK